MKHALDTKVAQEYGVNIALLLEHLQYWTFKNFTRNHHIYDGLCWMYDTLDALCQVFPYWTRRQIERVINNAVEAGVLVKGNYNHTKYDRTVWYALTPKAYAYYPDLLDEKYLKALWLSISPNGEIDFAEWRNGFPQTVTPIPNTIPDTDPNNKNIGASDDAQKLDYNFNKTQEEEKSDYPSNQQALTKSDIQVTESKMKLEKSDYFENQLKNKSNSKSFGLNDTIEDNPHGIPIQMIQDWITNRASKKLGINKTSWRHINTVLQKLKEKGIDPIEAFERMVANGWNGIEMKYFEKESIVVTPINQSLKNETQDETKARWVKEREENRKKMYG